MNLDNEPILKVFFCILPIQMQCKALKLKSNNESDDSNNDSSKQTNPKEAQ